MTAKTPIRTVFNESDVATGLAEFQTGEFIAVEDRKSTRLNSSH